MLLKVESVLGFAQIRAGKFVKNVKRFNIKKIIDELIEIQHYQAESKSIDILCSFKNFPANADDIVELSIHSDVKRISQVVNNLLANALKFTQDDGRIDIESMFVKGVDN